MTHSKRYRAAREKIDRARTYSLNEAIALVRATGALKFDASVEVHLHLGIDATKADQIVRASVVLPHGTGRTQRIAVFTTPAHEAEAKDAGADVVGGAALIEEIKKTGKADFDVAVATPDIMKNLAAVARILGQKGLMPSPRNETVTQDVAGTVAALKKGKLTFRSDNGGNVHALIGKLSMDDAALHANYETFLDAVKRAKPKDMKGTYLRSITLASAMGPGIKVQA